MVREVRVYIEGGGDYRDTKAFLRQGFSEFLGELIQMARSKRIRWQTVICGSRQAAFDAFKVALTQHPEAFNVLLVDSEEPVLVGPWRHLQERDGWMVDGIAEEHCHLMTQAMEAWFIADAAALSRYYGPNFYSAKIPAITDVEQIPKERLRVLLKDATRDTQKGEYHKIRHAARLLELIDLNVVRKASRHCERLFTTLATKIQSS